MFPDSTMAHGVGDAQAILVQQIQQAVQQIVLAALAQARPAEWQAPVARLARATHGALPVRDGAVAGARLSAREREVLREVARGRSNAEIAEALVLSSHTVKTHVARTLMKLRLRDRVQLVVFAYETGFVVRGDDPQSANVAPESDGNAPGWP